MHVGKFFFCKAFTNDADTRSHLLMKEEEEEKEIGEAKDEE